jgi:hypothetical protein
MILKEGIVDECRKVFWNFPEYRKPRNTTGNWRPGEGRTENLPNTGQPRNSTHTCLQTDYAQDSFKAPFPLWVSLRPVQRRHNILCLYLNASFHTNHHAHERVLCERTPSRKQSDYNPVFVGAFAKMRKTTISFDMCLHLRLSVRMDLGPNWTNFHKL